VKAALLALAGCATTGEPCKVTDAPGFDPSGKLCKKLSTYGLFDDIAAQTPAAGVIPYGVNTALFSDYALKQRFVVLPPGTQLAWSDRDAFDFPVGAMLVKTFAFDSGRLETRVLMHRDAGWSGASYVYDKDGTDATLAIAGKEIDAVEDPGYAVPNQNQCKTCHAEHDGHIAPLGPKARHWNKDGLLEQLVASGQLVGAPPRDSWPRAPDALDPATGTVDQRARAWLDINCGHCHNERGMARTSGLFLDIAQTAPAVFGVCKAPVATGRGSGGFDFDIVPGQPDKSILVYRIESTEPEIKMPEIGRNLVHAEGAALIREWITQMPGGC